MNNQKLYYKLHIIFILLLLFPCVGFIYFGYKYNSLRDVSIKLIAVVGLVYILVGFTLLRRLFDHIITISQTIANKVNKEIAAGAVDGNQGEIQQIIAAFDAVERRLQQSSEQLAKKSSEVSILKELSDLCYVTIDPWEILQVTLERALTITGADVGSVLILDKKDRAFVVKASIGLGDYVKINDRIDFDTSIGKYAVINKNPLIVADIEKEHRFGRTNRLHYGTKSFVIMPIKTIKDVIGVVTISRRDDSTAFSLEEVEALAPLLSNAAFTYENIRLSSELEMEEEHLTAVRKIFKSLNSSLKHSELLRTILKDIQEIIPFEIALVLVCDEKKPEQLQVIDLVANEAVDIAIGARFDCQDNIIAKVMQQESIRVVDDLSTLHQEVGELLLPSANHKACLLAPLVMQGKVNGVVVLYAKECRIFHEIQPITDCIANIVSFAIEESRLTAAVAKRNQELEAIKQIGSVLASSTFDIHQVLNYTMDMIRSLMNVEAGSLSLVKGDELEFAVSFEIDVAALQQFRLKLGQGISGAVAARGEAIVDNEIANSRHFYGKIDEATGFKTRSVLCVPMISQGRVIGVIEVMNRRQGDFSDKDKDLLQSIATSVSIALENARLYKETVAMADNERGIRNMFQKFVPKEIVNKIIGGGAGAEQALVEEFKTITLLNLDIRGFSDLTRKIGPHKSVAMLNHFFSVMGGIVFMNNGIVDKYLGDGFLALFGAPVSSARDADNAVTAALAMQKAIGVLNEEYFRELLGADIAIGVSIFTGDVVLGNIGFEMKMDYTVIGDPVNKVFELQEYTRNVPNSIIIDETTTRTTMSQLQLRDLKKMLGESQIYELMGRKTTE
ncbi:MAG: GAF domain-containing protein [Desulfobulbaceae bacterium]|nr:GAF domain-containing protein [Desulfobulbaceae bacterium]